MTEVVSPEIAAFHERAVAACRQATEALSHIGVQALITGSFAREKFAHYSEIDLLITSCPRHLKYAIEGIIADVLDDIPFRTIYLEDMPASRIDRLTGSSVSAADLE